jgi:hypothetical protein
LAARNARFGRETMPTGSELSAICEYNYSSLVEIDQIPGLPQELVLSEFECGGFSGFSQQKTNKP